MTLAGTAIAGPFEEGYAAYDRGDFAVALQQWRLAAAQGDADAQVGVGMMHHNGEGVSADDVEAMKWYRLAAAQGHARAKAKLVGR